MLFNKAVENYFTGDLLEAWALLLCWPKPFHSRVVKAHQHPMRQAPSCRISAQLHICKRYTDAMRVLMCLGQSTTRDDSITV